MADTDSDMLESDYYTSTLVPESDVSFAEGDVAELRDAAG